MGVKIGELSPAAQGMFSRRSAELAARGHLSPHHTHMLHHEKTVWLTKQRIEAALEGIKRLLLAYQIPYSENLAEQLKALIESWASVAWCRRAIDSYGRLDNHQRGQYESQLLQERGLALSKANLEVDLLVDAIKNQAGTSSVQSKELEQKFKILLSAGQARIDFEKLTEELKPIGGSIAILFVDIDNFKELNSRYTETVVDETILADAMRLIRDLAHRRGDAYRQGGEEFVIILSNLDPSEAMAFAEKVRSVFERTEFKVGEKQERITVSVGVALWSQHGTNYDEVLKRANQAEADAKQSRNKCVLAAQ